MKIKRNCVICYQEFEVIRSSHRKKTCSLPCRYKSLSIERAKCNPRAQINCSVCQKEMSVPAHLVNKKTCSLECLKKLRRVYYKVCRQCGKEIDVKNQTWSTLFCSKVCSNLGARGENNPSWVKDRLRICKQCGKNYETRTTKQRKSLLCGRVCYDAWRREHGRTHRAAIGHVTQAGYRKSEKVAEGKYCLEHRMVMSRHLGRELSRDEIIHHINGDSSDNRIENLHLCSQSEHMKIHRQAEKIGLAIMASENWIENIQQEWA